jgi:hypothetical protein
MIHFVGYSIIDLDFDKEVQCLGWDFLQLDNWRVTSILEHNKSRTDNLRTENLTLEWHDTGARLG